MHRRRSTNPNDLSTQRIPYWSSFNIVLVGADARRDEPFSFSIGILGFLATGTGPQDIKGNFGIQDQRLAIAWVKDNIAVFGGDPNDVRCLPYPLERMFPSFRLLFRLPSLVRVQVANRPHCTTFRVICNPSSNVRSFKVHR